MSLCTSETQVKELQLEYEVPCIHFLGKDMSTLETDFETFVVQRLFRLAGKGGVREVVIRAAKDAGRRIESGVVKKVRKATVEKWKEQGKIRFEVSEE